MDRFAAAFFAELAATREWRAAAAADPKTYDLKGMQDALIALSRLADVDTRAVDLYDEANRIIDSGRSMHERLLAIGDVVTRAENIFVKSGSTIVNNVDRVKLKRPIAKFPAWT
jgi:hypothetical protein